MALKEKQILKILKNLSKNDICSEKFQQIILDLESVKKRFPEDTEKYFDNLKKDIEYRNTIEIDKYRFNLQKEELGD